MTPSQPPAHPVSRAGARHTSLSGRPNARPRADASRSCGVSSVVGRNEHPAGHSSSMDGASTSRRIEKEGVCSARSGGFRSRRASFVVAVVALFVRVGGTAGAITAAAVPLAKRALVADNAKKLEGKTSAQLLATAAEQADVRRPSSPARRARRLASSRSRLRHGTLAPNQGGGVHGHLRRRPEGNRRRLGGPERLWPPVGHRPTPDGGRWKTYVNVSSQAPGQQTGPLYAICLK